MLIHNKENGGERVFRLKRGSRVQRLTMSQHQDFDIAVYQQHHTYLKERLDVGIIDHLYTKGVLSHADYDICREKSAKSEKVEELLMILRRKGRQAYRTFHELLQEHQPHIAERMELTLEADGTRPGPAVSASRYHPQPLPTTSSKLSVPERCARDKMKIFNDPVHGNVLVDYLSAKIIDTPQFQRLRFIKHLGGCYYLYPGATHNRFEHSIGVYTLAGQFVRTLQEYQPELNIDDSDIACVEIAALCHDLGHGPFSHVFEKMVIPKLLPDREWKHEDASIKMFDHLLAKNKDVKAELERYNVDTKRVKEMIIGRPLKEKEPKLWTEKRFLYEIVSNSKNGVDVDKWEYFARDCYNLGIRSSFDHGRYMKFVRVLNVSENPDNKLMRICMRDKEASNVYDMFYTRASLHRRAYQHRITKAADLMLADVLVEADKYLKIPKRSNGKQLKMSECIDDMEAYTLLTDSVLHQILCSLDENLEPARRILENLHSRKLYKCVAQASLVEDADKIERKDLPEIRTQIRNHSKANIPERDIVVDTMNFDYNNKNRDPVRDARFYSKLEPNKASHIPRRQVSHMLPGTFEEQMIVVFYKDPSQLDHCKKVASGFLKWCEYDAPVQNHSVENQKCLLKFERDSACEDDENASSDGSPK